MHIFGHNFFGSYALGHMLRERLRCSSQILLPRRSGATGRLASVRSSTAQRPIKSIPLPAAILRRHRSFYRSRYKHLGYLITTHEVLSCRNFTFLNKLNNIAKKSWSPSVSNSATNLDFSD